MRFIYCFFYIFLFSSVFFATNKANLSGFEENKGQWNNEVLFKSKFEGGNMWVMQHKFLYHFQYFSILKKQHEAHKSFSSNEKNYKSSILFVTFLNSNKVFNFEKKNKSENYFNYFIGNNKDKWVSDVRKYESIVLKNIYKGIDLNLSSKDDKTKYEFIVYPNIDYSQIKIEYNSYESIKLLKNGNLQIKTKYGELIEEKPFVYQNINGKQVKINSKFVLKNNVLSFKIDNYNTDFTLIIDPELIFATYNGALTDNFGMTATYGYDGTAYTAGMIFGNQFPIPDSNAFDITSNFTLQSAGFGRTDVFINKYSSDGTQMLWSTFLGGGNDISGTETAHSLICDSENNIYVYGVTSSPDFPVTANSYDLTFNGGEPYNLASNGVDLDVGSDIYVSKISFDGHNLLGSTFVGGSKNDGININCSLNYGDQFRGEIMLDSLNNIIVASSSFSEDFPMINSIQTNNMGNQEGVVFKISSDFSNLLFSTYIGGSGNDALYSIKIDSSYNYVFAGGTSSNDINPNFFTNSLQINYSGNIDGIIGKLSSDGISSLKLSYLGYSNYDQIYFVEINSNDEIFVIGQTFGSLFPIINSAYSVPNSSQFIAKINPQLNTILQSTLFGNGNPSNVNISPCAFLVDVCGNIYVSGWGDNISNLQTTPDALYPNQLGSADFYLFVLQSSFNLLYATYLGGNQTWDHVDGGTSRYDKNGVVYQSVCAGCGGFSDFPTSTNAWSSTNNSSNCNNLVYKFDFKLVGNSNFEVADTTGCLPFTVTFNNNSSNAHIFNWDFGNGTGSTTDLNPTVTYTQPGHYVAYLAIQDTVCLISDTMKTNIYVENLNLTFPNDTVLCTPTNLQFVPNSNGTANEFVWSDFSTFSNMLNNSVNDSTLNYPVLSKKTLYFQASNDFCSKIDTLYLDVISSHISLSDSISVCGSDTITIQSSSSGEYPFVYNWQPINLIYQQINDTTIITIPQIAEYIYLNISSNNCSFSDSIWIKFNPKNVLIDGFNDTLLCVPQNLTYLINSNGSADNFIWSSSKYFLDTLNMSNIDSSYTFFADSIIKLYVKAYSDECFDVDSVQIKVLSSFIDLEAVNYNCNKQPIQVNLVNNSNENIANTWYPNGIILQNINQFSVLVNPDSSTFLFAEIELQGLCDYKDSIFIPISNLDNINTNAYASDTIVPIGSQIQLWANPLGNYSYTWLPQNSLTNPNSQLTNATINQNTTYILQVSDGICTFYDTITILCYSNDCKSPQIYVPNAFSPNKKGKNEILYVRGPNIDKMLFRIYNRWGELMFESTDPNVGWDGTYKGKEVDPDVFDYYLEVSCIAGNKELIKGNVTILK